MKQNSPVEVNEKTGFDFQSLRFKLWAYFTLFAVILMGLLWFLQVAFYNYYYEELKMDNASDVAHLVAMSYGEQNFYETIAEATANNDILIRIESSDGSVLFEPSTLVGALPDMVDVYSREHQPLKEKLEMSQTGTVTDKVSVNGSSLKILSYATYLDRTYGNEVIMYVYSPLYPADSTIKILKDLLLFVTIISVIFATCFGLYLSRRITKPLKSINNTAKKLAKGEYGIRFQGGHYSELDELADTLTDTSMELERASTMQEDLIANVSHDLRTPLTMIKSYGEMIRDLSGNNPEKREKHLGVILEEADRMNNLVSDMLQMSRMHNGVIQLEKTMFSLKEATESIIATYGVMEEMEGYNIFLNCKDDFWVTADEPKIKQVISNLINNAIKYCGTDRTIYVSITKRQGKAHFEVTDHGMGISQDELQYIWDKYYKASTNHVRTTSGSGLGLSIVKSVCELHNADYGVESELGKGSTFWFDLKL